MLFREEEVMIQRRVVSRAGGVPGARAVDQGVVTEERPVSGEVREEHMEVDDRDVGPSLGRPREVAGCRSGIASGPTLADKKRL